MYKITKNVIEMGGFNLTDILRKIDSLWIKGSITDDERADLYNMAQTKAKAKDSIDIVSKIADLEARIVALEAKLEGAEDVAPEDTEESVSYEEFIVGKWYYTGNRITFEGKNYVCIAPEGTVCVWSPTDYPSYWEEVTSNG